jgi:hypothetical protein
MSFFCLLWMPLVYLFRTSLSGEYRNSTGGVWALILGTAVALAQFFIGPLVSPGGFGFSRWLSVLVDVIGLPALLPFLLFGLFTLIRVFSGPGDMANFVLLWLIPEGILRALTWSAQNEPIRLVLTPLLWTAVALGIPFFFRIILDNYRLLAIIPAALGILAVPLGAITCYWAFFSQDALWGWVFLTLTLSPVGVFMGISLGRNRG